MTSTTSLKCLNRKKNVIQPGCPGPSRTIDPSASSRWRQSISTSKPPPVTATTPRAEALPEHLVVHETVRSRERPP
eukprot:5360004-Prymnesium_polylepis.1